MTTSPSSGLSPEAKEFVPLVQNPTASIPLYVDENTVASIYPSDQQPLMVQTIYPMMITNSKVADNIQFPEIEFHIQPSQQQQFHIDSCTNMSQVSSTNGNSSRNNTSQIVLLPTTNSTTAVTPTGYYAGPQIIYSTNESLTGFYPIDYCEQPLINFSLQQPTQITKSDRISSQQQRPSSFRQQHGTYRPSSRGGNRGNGTNNTNRNPYYDYNNRRNGSSYTPNSGRGNSSNSKRISSSYHQHDYNNYYHSSPRSRGYLSRVSQQPQHDEYRKDHFDYYNQENDYQQSTQMNDDGTPFEFRSEDFPSLPINHQPSDKTPPQSTTSTNTKPTSSWNVIVSAPRPRSTSPHSIPPSQDPRSDRSRSFNNKLSSNNERKSSNKKPNLQPTTIKSSNRASKRNSQEDQQPSPSLTNTDLPIIENNLQINDNKDDGFIQTKHQHRRLKRKNKIKEETIIIESTPYALDDENAFPTLGQQINKNDSNPEVIQKSNTKTYQTCLTDMFDALSTSTQVKQENFHHQITTNLSDTKPHKPTKFKRIIDKELEPRQQSLSKVTVEQQSDEKKTDTNTANVVDEDLQNSNALSSSNNNSSDTSDYDDAVDNLDDE
jgi:hypothetical protein